MTERRDMDTNLDAPATRRDLRKLRDEMDERFREQDARLTTQDARLTRQFDALVDALVDRIDRRMEERFAAMSQDVARMLGISAEATRGELRIIDDQYKDLPGRVARLEDAVFKPAPRRGPRKRRSA